MTVFVLIHYLTPFSADMPPDEQVSILGVYTEEAAEAAKTGPPNRGQ